MGYTLEQVRAMVMDVVGDDSVNPTYWTPSTITELDEWILDALEEWVVLTGAYTEEIAIPLFADRKHYQLDPARGGQMLWIKHLLVSPEMWSLKGTSPAKLSREDYTWMTRTGTPRSFYPVGLGVIRIIPYPSEDGQVLEGTIVCVPASYNLASELVDIRDDSVSFIIDYVASLLLLSTKRLDKAKVFLRRYIEIGGLGVYKLDKVFYKQQALRGVGDTDVAQ